MHRKFVISSTLLLLALSVKPAFGHGDQIHIHLPKDSPTSQQQRKPADKKTTNKSNRSFGSQYRMALSSDGGSSIGDVVTNGSDVSQYDIYDEDDSTSIYTPEKSESFEEVYDLDFE